MSIYKGEKGLPAMLVRRIGALRGLSRISDGNYYALLGGYGVESCKDLSPGQAEGVIAVLQRLVGPEKRRAPERYADIKGRSVLMATPPQLRMLEGMWMQVTRQTTPGRARAAYVAWLHGRFGIATPEWIERSDVGKIKLALEMMARQDAGKKYSVS